MRGEVLNMKNYFRFTQAEEKYLTQINNDYDNGLSKYAAKNLDVIRVNKVRHDIIRSGYSYDIDYILHCPFYNRYTDNTQVFSFYKNDDLSRRALHVQLVSKIARTIGRALKLNLELIEAIALGHDIGHTPFGHKGEEFLSECYQEGTEKNLGVRRYFNHNVHSARIFRYILNNKISLQTLSGILSHNGEKVCREYTPSELNDFDEFDVILEKCYIDNSFHKTLRPNTLEGCVVRISDMIAYAGKDRQDLYKANLITEEQFKSKRLIGTKNSDIISNLVINIIKNSINSSSLNMDEEVFEDLKDLIDENYKIIYSNEQLNEPYYELIKPLMADLYFKLKNDIEKHIFDSPVFTHYLNLSITGDVYREKKSRKIIVDSDTIVADYIASMTDDYFIDLCKYLHIDDEMTDKIRYIEYF